MDKPVWTIMKILNWTKQHFEAKGVEIHALMPKCCFVLS